MRPGFAILLLPLLCVACGDANETTVRDHRWFSTYQSDRSCQTARPPVHDEDIKGPTGRAHPF